MKIFLSILQTICLNEEVNCTEPSPSVSSTVCATLLNAGPMNTSRIRLLKGKQIKHLKRTWVKIFLLFPVFGLFALRDVLLSIALRRRVLSRRQCRSRRSKRIQKRPFSGKLRLLKRPSRLDHIDAERRVSRSTFHRRGRFEGSGLDRGQRRTVVIYQALQPFPGFCALGPKNLGQVFTTLLMVILTFAGVP